MFYNSASLPDSENENEYLKTLNSINEDSSEHVVKKQGLTKSAKVNPSMIDRKKKYTKMNSEQERFLINKIKGVKYLWNPAHEDYKRNALKSAAYDKIATLIKKQGRRETSDISGIMVRQKFNYLKSCYFKEKSKMKLKSTGTDDGSASSSWPHFADLSFLNDADCNVPSGSAANNVSHDRFNEVACDTNPEEIAIKIEPETFEEASIEPEITIHERRTSKNWVLNGIERFPDSEDEETSCKNSFSKENSKTQGKHFSKAYEETLGKHLPQQKATSSSSSNNKRKHPPCSLNESNHPSCSLNEPKHLSYSLNEPKHPSYSLNESKNPSYSLNEPKHPSHSLNEYKHPSYSLNEPKHPSYSLDESVSITGATKIASKIDFDKKSVQVEAIAGMFRAILGMCPADQRDQVFAKTTGYLSDVIKLLADSSMSSPDLITNAKI